MGSTELGLLVGVDGSEESLRAAEWAAAAAAPAGQQVTACHVSDVVTIGDVPAPERLRAEARARGQELVDRVLARIGARASVPAAGRVVEGNPAAELLRLAASAEQVVVGSRHSGVLERLVLGSVAAQVAAHAPGPVVVVRGGATARHEVVVGVGAADRGHLALQYAFEYAARHGKRVHAVHAVPEHARRLPAPPAPLPAADLDEEQAGRQFLADAVAPWTFKFPAVPVDRTVVVGYAPWVLTEASTGAALVVVGAHEHGGHAAGRLGAVSRALLRHADCPVAVVR